MTSDRPRDADTRRAEGGRTVPDGHDPTADVRSSRRAARVRLIALGLIGAFLMAGLLGGFGVRTGEARSAAARDGTTVGVRYPAVARPGLAVSLQVRVARPGGFDAPIEVRLPLAYLRAFDVNAVTPAPAEETSDARDVEWTFDPPEGGVLTVVVDLRVEPGVQWRVEGSVAAASGAPAGVGFDTWIAP